MNHSCAPNAVVSYKSEDSDARLALPEETRAPAIARIVALHDIAEGEEMCIHTWTAMSLWYSDTRASPYMASSAAARNAGVEGELRRERDIRLDRMAIFDMIFDLVPYIPRPHDSLHDPLKKLERFLSHTLYVKRAARRENRQNDFSGTHTFTVNAPRDRENRQRASCTRTTYFATHTRPPHTPAAPTSERTSSAAADVADPQRVRTESTQAQQEKPHPDCRQQRE